MCTEQFPKQYYLLTKRHKKYDLQWLKVCSFIETLYTQEQEIIRNKGVMLAFLSVISWICEIYLYYIIFKIFGLSFNFDILSIYIRDIFSISQGIIVSMYAILFAIIYCFAELFLLIRWGK